MNWKCDLENDVLNKADLGKTGKIEEKKFSFDHYTRATQKWDVPFFIWQNLDKKLVNLNSVHWPRLYLALNYQSEIQILNGLLTVTN